MRFSINLATRTYLNHRLLNLIIFGVIVVLVVLLGWNVTRISSSMGEQQRLVSGIKSLEDVLNIRPDGVTEKDFVKQQASIRFFNEIIDRKGRGWLDWLDLIENATPEGVSLTALVQGKQAGELKLDGRAKSFSTVRRYLEKLEESKSISDVMLLSHQEVIAGENVRGVQFQISCRVQF